MKTLYQLKDAELDAFLDRARRSLADQASELRWTSEPGDILAAMDTTLSMLLELRGVRLEKQSAIDLLITTYSAS